VIVSRVLDVSPIWWLHVPMMLLLLLIILTALRGELRMTFRSKITLYFTAFTAWVIACFPLSEWRAASLGPLTEQLQAFAIFVIVVQTIRTAADWRRLAGTYAYAIVAASLLAFYINRSVENGRLALAYGSLADPNEYALTLVLGLPFCWYKANTAAGVRKTFWLLCTVPIFVTFARTGSRSGLFALAALLFVTFILGQGGRKMLIAIGTVVLVTAAAFFLPDYLKARYFTIFSPAEVAQLDTRGQAHLQSDISSSEGRKALLIQSIRMTVEHPLFGVGPGVFSFASWDERKASGAPAGLAQVTHNTYTQISSETGIPGFILFVIALFLSVKVTLAIYRAAANPELAKKARYLFESFVGLSVGIFFLSVGYSHTLAVMFAFAVSLRNITEAAAVPSEADKVPGVPARSQAPVAAPTGRSRHLRPTYLGSRGRV
jgi:O-antigen ligase